MNDINLSLKHVSISKEVTTIALFQCSSHLDYKLKLLGHVFIINKVGELVSSNLNVATCNPF